MLIDPEDIGGMIVQAATDASTLIHQLPVENPYIAPVDVIKLHRALSSLMTIGYILDVSDCINPRDLVFPKEKE